MHHALSVCVVERACHFGHDPYGIGDRELLLAVQSLTQRLAAHHDLTTQHGA